MKTKKAETGVYLPVIFRRWRGNPKTIIALFPTVPEDTYGNFCMSYEHVGQHGGATPALTSSNITRAVDPKDSDVLELWRELIGIGYTNLRPYRRNRARFNEQRRAVARQQREAVSCNF